MIEAVKFPDSPRMIFAKQLPDPGHAIIKDQRDIDERAILVDIARAAGTLDAVAAPHGRHVWRDVEIALPRAQAAFDPFAIKLVEMTRQPRFYFPHQCGIHDESLPSMPFDVLLNSSR
ncbi:bll1762 [Bradyrhizobium diazoefficiens USDA 110]|uniref:Bll1762 protein n=1 Tax=Bradyrhizobium diazoefficiens (strain JCM 10833 / BCRC 13528 / IAM 13628 / NBRC 14792 / USDA 110) TaxID=224911 RepID=Q89TR5_BRADU|nr:hypothetical protein CO678_40790 [Bradyrhizobium diazoefficiens]BAC47027.1 bll1762 [Bradyrhizobium diazoefficiens USDA 110]